MMRNRPSTSGCSVEGPSPAKYPLAAMEAREATRKRITAVARVTTTHPQERTAADPGTGHR